MFYIKFLNMVHLGYITDEQRFNLDTSYRHKNNNTISSYILVLLCMHICTYIAITIAKLRMCNILYNNYNDTLNGL